MHGSKGIWLNGSHLDARMVSPCTCLWYIIEWSDDSTEQLEVNNFKASEGWLDKFKLRYGIVFKTISGEACS